MSETLMAAIAALITAIAGYIDHRARANKRDRAEEIREWRYSVLGPAVVEWWHTHDTGTDAARVSKVFASARTLAARSQYKSVRNLDDDTVRDMVVAALGTISGVGRSGVNTYGG